MAGKGSSAGVRGSGLKLGLSSRSVFFWVWSAGYSSILASEIDYERGLIVMAHDFEQKYVAMVAAIIGAVVLLLGIGGILFNLS